MDSTDGTWDSHLGETELYGRQSKTTRYIQIEDAKQYSSYQHASHTLIYAKTSKIALNLYTKKAIVLMQMRFDGYLGFPGGLVDAGEVPTEAATREMVEEMSWDTSALGEITEKDLLFSHLDEEKKLVLHFFAKEITEDQITEVEQRSLRAVDHGEECLGLLQVPLYTMGDSYRGLPAFLNHNFVGNAKMQLVEGLVRLNILSRQQVDKALHAVPL